MRIGDICTREVVSLDGGSTLQDAAALMRERHIGALLVTGATPLGPRALGVVTDRDLVVEAMARGLSGENVRLGTLAEGKLATIPAAGKVEDAITAMGARGVRRLLVATADGELYGILTLEDLLDAMAHRMLDLAKALRGGIERETQERPPIIRDPAPVVRGLPL